MAKNIDNLNFKVILDDRDFDTRVKADIQLAKDLNIELSKLLQAKVNVNTISAQDAASAKRASDILTKQATDQEKIRQAKAKTAEAEEKVATQAAKTTKELERANAASSRASVNAQRQATEIQRTAAATNQAAVNAQRLKTETQRTATEVQRTATATQNAANATARAQLAQRRLADSARQTTREYQTQSRLVNELKGFALGYLSIHGASQLLSSLVRVTGEFELQKTTLSAMLGDLNQAEQIITRIQGLAVESPFQFKELTTYAKQLSAFSVPAAELYDTTKMLADVSAGLGVGMDRLVLAYGQVRSAAFLRGQEVRQFTEAGIPILNMLAEQFEELEGQAVSTGEVFDRISKRLVPFEMVAKAFKDMTSEGGKFFNMQEIQAETLRGKISNLKDAYEVMLNEIGEGQSEKLKGAVDWAKRLMQNYEDTGRVLMELIASYGVYKATLISVEVATNTFALANHKLVASLVSAGKYLAKNPYMIIAAGITAAGYAIYKNHTELEGYQKIQKSIARTQADYTKEISKETSKLDALYAKLKLAKKGTKEYNEARKEIFTQYSGYISELKAEGIEVENLIGIYENLKTKIEDATKARTSSKAKQKLTETYDQQIDSYYDKYIEIITNARKELNRQAKLAGGEYKEFSEFEKAGFWKFVSGSMNKNDLERTNGLERVVNVLNNATIDASANLKDLRVAMQATTREYNKSLQEIKLAYGEVDVDSGGNLLPGMDSSASDERVASIKKEIEALKTLKNEYDSWRKLGAKDSDVALALQGYFPNIKEEYGEDFITQLNFATRILEKIKELEKISPDEAYNLKMSFGTDKSAIDKQIVKDQIKAYEDVAKAVEKYYSTLRKWASEDFNLNGEGIVLDVSKIASDFAAKANEIELSARKAKELFGQIDLSSEESIEKVKAIFIKEFGADAWGEFWTTYEKEGESAIRNLADAQIAYERKLAQEKLNDLASKYVKEVYFTGNISLEDLGDKTFSQLGNIKKKLQDLLDKDPLQIPLDVYGAIDSLGVDLNNLVGQDLEEIFKSLEGNGLVIDDATKSTLRLTQQIQKAGLSTEQFGEIIKQVIGGDLKNLTEEQSKALMEMIESYMSEMGNLLSSLADYAEAIGNDELQGAVNGIAQAMDIIGSMADRLSKGDWVGAIISGLTSMATIIIDAAKAEAELNRQIAETRNELRLLASQNAISKDVETIFGVDEYKKFTNAYEEAAKAHKQALEDIQKQNEEFKGRSSDNWGAGGVLGAVGAGAAAGAGIGALAGGWFGGITIAAGAIIGGLVGLITGLTGAVATEANDYALTLQEMADSLGADLVDDTTGAFNSETLKSIKEAYTDLDSESKEMIDKLITNAEIYENAITEMANYMTEMFGQCADSMADSFITAFKESGQAALDYEDLMDDVATNIAKSIIKSAILQNIFTEEDAKNAATKLASGDAPGAMEIVESAMEKAKELTPEIQALLDSLKPYMQMGEEAGQSLGDGIKGITEDTANLLASYLNAIRADVSYSKVLWQNMDSNLQALAASLANFSAPSLMEYQQQIAANTLNTANHTRDILDTLTGLLVSGNEGSAIRVYM